MINNHKKRNFVVFFSNYNKNEIIYTSLGSTIVPSINSLGIAPFGIALFGTALFGIAPFGTAFLSSALLSTALLLKEAAD